MELKEQVVFISGASSGIGRACAYAFAKLGTALILAARRIDRLTELAAELRRTYGVEVLPLQLDVRNQHEIKSAIESLELDWRKVSVLVNNAGLARGKDKAQSASLGDWTEMIETNLLGLVSLTHAILPGMVDRNRGHIINISSVAGHEVYQGGSVYCATKHAVTAFSSGLKRDLLGTSVRVSNISPGAVETEFSVVRFHGDQQQADAVYRDMRPLTAKDVADAVIYCATCPAHVNIQEITLLATDQSSAVDLHRKTP